MTTVSEVISFLDVFAPPQLAEDWDNVGLLIGRRDSSVQKALTCLTLTEDVAAEAVEQQVQLIVTHHPILFRGAKQITDATSEGELLLGLIENGVAVISPHTSFDSAVSGVNQWLAESFGLIDIAPVRLHHSIDELGSGRVGSLPEAVGLREFLKTACSVTDGKYLEFSGKSDATVSKVAVACGSAAEFMQDAMKLGCDTFVTGEARFHSVLEARTAGMNLVLLGHYSSERPAIERLASVLDAEFPAIQVWASSVECDPLSVFVP